ncbi:MAG: hypothetical protein KAW83_04795 [Dehalococcoidia bacterium]|nr:hypothetical protein [Dehalococcoidia bacterium]
MNKVEERPGKKHGVMPTKYPSIKVKTAIIAYPPFYNEYLTIDIIRRNSLSFIHTKKEVDKCKPTV